MHQHGRKNLQMKSIMAKGKLHTMAMEWNACKEKQKDVCWWHLELPILEDVKDFCWWHLELPILEDVTEFSHPFIESSVKLAADVYGKREEFMNICQQKYL